jgi:hypothetical protein
MKQALFLFLALALALPACAQEPGNSGGSEVTSVTVSPQTGKVRVEIHTSTPVSAPGSVVNSPDNLIIDLPGVIYRESAHRYRVNRNGVHDVRIWQQSQNPPLTRISIELDRTSRYLISAEAGGLILQLGPSVPGGIQNAASIGGGKRENPPAASGRPSGPARAVGSIAGVFGRSKEPNYGQQQAPVAQPPSPEPPSSTSVQVSPPLAPDETQAGNTTPPPQAEPSAFAAPPAEPAPPTATAAVATAPSGAETSIASNVPEPAPAESKLNAPAEAIPTPAPASAPVAAVTSAVEEVSAAATPPSPAPAPAEVAAAEPPAAPATVTTTPAVAPAPLCGSEAAAAAAANATVGGRPVTSQDVAVAQAFVEVPNADLRTVFHVKFVQQDSAYIDGGRSSGLTEGMKLFVKDPSPAAGADANGPAPDTVQAELVVVGVAETSAVTEVHEPKRDVVPGDLAYLSSQDTQALVQQHALGTTRQYPAVISFTEGGDALDAEAHAEVPRPPMPSANRARIRVGFDYMGTQSTDSSQFSSRDVGLMLQADYTRIGGTYWNLNGYWRGQLNSASSPGQFQTLQELINRTYHMSLTYDNPNSHWVAGFGRMYLPWASSLDTIDGGYFGRRVRPGFIAGIFAGTTPDPTSWNYNPNLQMGGAFVNFAGGSFDAFHYSSTSGAGVNLISWQINRPFLFFENSLSYRRTLSIYQALQADSPAGNPAVAAPGPGIGRSFTTIRWSPFARLQLDANHTYFRDVPTFDPTLVGTGLLDKYLFQGFSGGAHVDVVKQISVYTELGRSNRTGDAQGSLNQMYGVTFGHVPFVGLRADAHYSAFNSSFGSGTYEAITLSRSFGERMRLDVLLGDQAFTSTLAGNQSARFLTATADSSLGTMFFAQGSFTVYRGQLQSYDQWLLTLGYRFDSKSRHK